MQRIKAVVALILAVAWLPAVSCCLIDASGLLGKRDCCSKQHSHSIPGPGNCDQPCGTLASASYFPQQNQEFTVTPAPIGLPLFDRADVLALAPIDASVSRDFPATAPPELAGHWQFTFRTALPSRAPSFAS